MYPYANRAALLAPAFLLFALSTALAARAQTPPPFDHPLFTGPVHADERPPFDQEHLRLDLKLNPAAAALSGTAALTLTLLADSLDAITLFARGLDVGAVRVMRPDSSIAPATYRQGRADSLVIGLDSLALGDRLEVQVDYSAHPGGGLFFAGDGAATYEVWSVGDPEANRYWFPVQDAPADKFSTELIVTVPRAMQVFGSGALVEERTNPDRTRTFHYVQDLPTPAYLVALSAGPYEVTRDTVRAALGADVPLTFAAAPDQRGYLTRTFGATAGILRFLEERLGAPFPWPGYAQVVTRATDHEGSAQAGVSVYPAGFLLDERALLDAARLDVAPEPRLAFALSRQWLGALVTSDRWSDLWLHDGLAAYLAAAYLAQEKGENAYAFLMDEAKARYLEETQAYRRPLVWDQWEHPSDLLDAHNTDKGAWVLHMLHRQLGDAAFWRALSGYVNQYAFASAHTDAFTQAFGEAGDLSISAFFDQWVYSAGHPELEVRYTFSAAAESLEVKISQKQDGFLTPQAFDLDVPIDVYTLVGKSRFEVRLSEREQAFTFPLRLRPRFVLVDPDHTYLLDIHTTQDPASWVSQLRYAEHPLDRRAAARALLGYTNDPALLIGLRTALSQESVAEVRAAIVRTIGALTPAPPVEQALLSVADDEDARVRAAVMEALSYYEGSNSARAAVRRAANSDRSYRVQAAAVAALARLGAPDAPDIIRSALITPSHRDVIRTAALRALPYAAFPAQEGLQTGLKYSVAPYRADVRSAAAEYLQTLAPSQRSARRRLVALLEDENRAVRETAIEACAALAVEDTLTALQRRLTLETDPQLRKRIEEVLGPANTGK